MRRNIFLLILVGSLLFVSPVLAEIQAFLETPGPSQEVSGKSLISGWAFSTTGAQVVVILRVNGTTNPDVVIPCCGPRADVQAQFPGAPLNSGFGLLQNYGIFDPAILNSIGVEITAGGETRIIDSPVTLVKPGSRGSDVNPTIFSFLDQLSPAGGRVAIDGEEIIIAGATVADNDAGGTRKATLRLLWTGNTQTFSIVASASGTSFDGVQEIFNNKCATELCHDNITRIEDLDLSEGKPSEGRSFRRIVAVRSDIDTIERFRVNPGKAFASYLYHKIIENGTDIVGDRMPPACVSDASQCLSAEDIQTIANWINEGAPPPQ